MNNIKLSYSGAERFSKCGESYRLHYIERYRTINQSSALFFGKAIDEALDDLLCGKDPVLKFLDTWTTQKLNDETLLIKNSHKIIYSNTDLDLDIILEEDLKQIDIESFNILLEKKNTVGFINMTDDEKSSYNEVLWYSLKAKGLLMIEAFKQKIAPNIEKVYGTQIKIELKNELGDELPGYCDTIIKWKGIDKPIIFDIKTSGSKYEEDAVLKSNQLATYLNYLSQDYENTRMAGYLVLSKKIKKTHLKECSVCKIDGTGSRAKTCDSITNKKRCSGQWTYGKVLAEAEVQILINEIPYEFEEKVLDNYETVANQIKANKFEKNYDSCYKFFGPCSFLKLCHKKSDEGLVKVPNK